ncbi:MAG: FAD-binding protein, partial [Acidimicrobiia bacterium]|nr:FAD-binding protein [Acidimicrobiia bacterium]
MTTSSDAESSSTGPYPSGFVDELIGVVGVGNVLSAPEVTSGYLVDWTGRFRAGPAVVVRPATTEETAAVVGVCSTHGVAVCPQGGNTGLVGGSVPLDGGLVVSTRRLKRLDSVDVAAGSVTAG